MFSKPPRDPENNPSGAAAPQNQNQGAMPQPQQNQGPQGQPPVGQRPAGGMPMPQQRPQGAMPPPPQMRPQGPQGSQAPQGAVGRPGQPMPQRPQQQSMPRPAPQPAPAPAARSGYSRAMPERNLPIKENDNGRLTVGQEIKLNGEIRSCDRLTVEGTVEATLSDSRALEVVETGIFRGTATVDVADINGVFDGELSVEGRLLVRANGQVTGTIRYGELEIERGGRISGSLEEFSSPSSSAQRNNFPQE